MPQPRNPRTARARRRKIAYFALAALVLIPMTFPVYWLVVSSLRPGGSPLPRSLADLFPFSVSIEHYVEVLSAPAMAMFMWNSLFVAVVTTVVTLVAGALAGYALARLRFPGRGILGVGVLLTYVLPAVLLVTPVFVVLVGLGFYNTHAGLIIAHVSFALPFAIWMLRAYFTSLPVELEDAAMIDGASRIGALWRVVLPLAVPGLAATAIFTFLLSWNEFLYALTLLTDAQLRTLPVGIATSYMTLTMTADDWSRLMAASVIAALPVFAVFLGMQKWLVGGLSAGAVKG